MSFEPVKVGDLARRTGLTVRTLHHYDEIGLVTPSFRTGSGHRLYAAGDVARLQRVVSLRQLGFSLEEIRGCLDEPAFAPLAVVRLHRSRLQDQIELQKRLCDRLDALAVRLEQAGEVSADEFIRTIEEMTMIEKIYTPEQLNRIDRLYTPEQKEQFREAAKQVGQEEINAVQDGWIALLPEVRANLHLDPESEKAQELGRRWEELLERTMAGWKQFPQLGKAVEDNYKAGKFDGFVGAPQAAEFAFIEKVKAAREAGKK